MYGFSNGNNYNNHGSSLPMEISDEPGGEGSLKVATLNVHCWTDANDRDNLDRVIRLVKTYDPDVLCLQETHRSFEELFLFQTDFSSSVRHDSVAILAKPGLLSAFDSPADRAKRITPYVTAKIRLPCGNSSRDSNHVYVTNMHLDHRIEPTRLREVRDLRRDLSPLFEARSHQIWTGDFNALTREDYSPEFWEDVSRIRENNKWELPQTDLTREVKGYGFVDTWVEAGSRPPVKTCRFNTRIDYIYATGHLLGDCKETTTSSKLRIKSVRHIPDQASDHNMVIAEMTAAV